MANFEKTDGWQNELENWTSSEDFSKKPKSFDGLAPEMERHDVLLLAGLMIRDRDCFAAIEKLNAWRVRNPDTPPMEDKENFPWHEDRTLRDFERWFQYKKDWDQLDFPRAHHARRLASEVARGAISFDDAEELNHFLDVRNNEIRNVR